jgi:DNA modification methylase
LIALLTCGSVGGGTTGVVSVKLGRRFLGIELDPAVAAGALARVHRASAATA